MSSITEELKKKIEELELQLKLQQEKEEQEEDPEAAGGLWEYDIAGKRLIQSKKLDGQWSENSLVVENYRQQVREWNLIYVDDWPVFEAYCDSMDNGDAHFAYELRAMSDDAQFIWLRYEGNTIYDDNGKPLRVIGCTKDITGEKKERDHLEKQVSRDLLTGLYTKEIASRMIEKTLPNDAQSGGALIILDVDDFKAINDKYGRVYGDAMLETISGIIYTHFRTKDIVSRIDGDEFLIYCSGISGEKEAIRLVEKLMIRFQEFVVDRDGNRVGLSAGIAIYPKHGSRYGELEDSAAAALSYAKKQGKNQYVIYDAEIEYMANKEAFRPKRDENWQNAMSAKQLEGSNKELFDFAFDIVCREKNFYDALQIIFKEVCLYFSLDRGTLIECRKDSGKITGTVKWSREEDGNDAQIMEESSRNNWPMIESLYGGKDYAIIDHKKMTQESFERTIVHMKKVPVVAVLLPIMDNGKMTGALTFESWTDREWTQTEVSTLSSIAKMISGYLLCLQTKSELETEYQVSKKAMDVQNLIYYMVDAQTYKLQYMSHFAREHYSDVKYGQKCYEALKGRTSPCTECPIRECTQKNDYTNTIEVYDGEEDSWYTVIASKMDSDGNSDKYLLCQSDVTAFLERVKGEDQLTGTLSYEKFRLEAVKAIRRGKDGYMLAFVGIQGFSRINDEYGYEVGDQVLRTFADLMRRNVGEGEYLCRIKGDDFAVLLKERPTEIIKKHLEEHSEALTSIFRERFPNISFNCFGGVYFVSDTLEHISRCIDKAMKARKVVLKNFYETGGIYTYTRDFELQEKERENMNRAMQESLEKGYFKVFFQPKVDAVTEEIVGAEALVRLVDKHNQLVSPGKFIPLAEESGLIVEIDRFVYEETFRLMSQWQKDGKQLPLVSVNLSRLHLLDDGFPEMIKSLSDKYGLRPEQIELEITESVFFEDTERLVNMIKRIKDLGYVISMDDFGAGFSTLSLMKTLPIDVLKLDGSFFLRNELDTKNKAVISAIMQLAKNLQFETVSEGVETKEQIEFIKEQGGRCVQGFYFYRPMPADDFKNLLK